MENALNVKGLTVTVSTFCTFLPTPPVPATPPTVTAPTNNHAVANSPPCPTLFSKTKKPPPHKP